MQAILEVNNISKHYGTRPVIQNLSLSLKAGEFFSLLGPSGCGKSTLLRIIAGFDQEHEGRIVSKSQDITEVPARRRDCNVVFQNYALFPHMTVFRNVAFGLEMQKKKPDEIQRDVEAALDLVQMRAFADRLPQQLSGGQQQRVALARAIAPKPSLLLLDEPLGALDLKLRRDMQIELKHLQRRLGITFLFVTHDQDEAMSLSDRMAIMDHGRILQMGTPQEIYEEPASQAVASFLGEADFFTCELRAGAAGWDAYCKQSNIAFPIADPHGREGDQVVVPVRPEQWDIIEGPGLVEGRIEELIYRGKDSSAMVRLPDGRLLQILSPSGKVWRQEQTVSLKLRGAALRALPRGPA